MGIQAQNIDYSFAPTLGRGSIIGANVFLAKSVPPESKVFAPPARVGHLSKEERKRGADEG